MNPCAKPIGRARPAALLASLLIALALAPTARADVSADMTHDLAVSGVPGAQVQVGVPANADEAELNPDSPTMQVAHVTISAPAPKPLASVMQPAAAGSFEFTDLPPDMMVWELAVLEAAKHAVANGTPLAGATITANVAGQPPATHPDVMVGLADISPGPVRQATMPIDTVRTQIQTSLPPWAAGATVGVMDDAAGQRIVTLVLAKLPIFFVANDARILSDVLASQQAALTAQGANIGRGIVRVTDVRSGDPLYVSADDALLGSRSFWDSPLVAGFIGPGLLRGDLLSGATKQDTAPVTNAIQSAPIPGP